MDTPGPSHGTAVMTADEARVTDAAIVARIAAGDEAALAAAYDLHADVVYGSVMRLLDDREAAEAVTRDVFLAAWQQAEQYSPDSGALLGWLLTFAHAKAADRLRAIERRPRLVVVGSRGDLAARSDAPGSQAVARPFELAVTRTVLSTMPVRERAVLKLAYEDGLKQAEIADRLGMSIADVNARTRSALAAMRAALDGATGTGDAATGPAVDRPRANAAPGRSSRGRDAAR